MKHSKMLAQIEEDELNDQISSIKNCPIEEILAEKTTNEEFPESCFPSLEDNLVFERDFGATAKRLIDNNLSAFEAEKQSIMDMREYYSDGNIDPEVDLWLKEQENIYQIGSCYNEDDFLDSLDDYPDYGVIYDDDYLL